MLPQGFYKNMSMQEYHHGIGAFAEPKSSLAHILDSPRKFKFEKSQPELDVFDAKAEKFNNGTALGIYFNEPDKFVTEISIIPTFAGKGSQAERKDYQQSVRDLGLVPITMDTHEMLQDFYTLLHSGEHETAREVLEHPDRFVEYSGFWQDPETGIWLKTRPDLIASNVVIWDIKKHTSIKSFRSQAMDLNYDLQAYMAVIGCSILGDNIPHDFGFIVFHAKEKPYDIEIVMADNDFLRSGKEKFFRALDILNHCREIDKWPGKYPDEIGMLSPTDYRLRQLETGIYD
ncbi:MAG: PD-(D/E)XK nuclease-like domain-containing protein [Nanoarchaeota archaeon]|nr:PD-(D/E)XK nuclease-like domain-containing protein [Nanoarchaeota archaeon]